MRIVLTGIPGIGKTTIIQRTISQLNAIRCSGFYTEEKRHQGQRIGFKVVTLEGTEGTLASIERGRAPMVGRYTVHVAEFERLVLPQLDPQNAPADLYVIDEIGRMELLSAAFRERLVHLLAQPCNLLATVAKKGKGFIEQIKARNDVQLLEVTRENRDDLPGQLAARILKEITER